MSAKNSLPIFILAAVICAPAWTGALAATKNSKLKICSGYGCIYKEEFGFTASQARKLKSILAQGASSAKAERKAVGQAITQMERMTRARLRFSRDVKKAYQKNAGRRGQMDCVDESLNTTQYLTYLHRNGWLKHHRPRRSYAERGFILDGRYPHKSAVMIDKANKGWAVDSWPRDGGEPPQIMPLSKWYRARSTDG